MPRQISSSLLREGMVLGRSLCDAKGQVLLREGVALKPSYIQRIQKLFPVVYIDEPGFEDLEVPETIPQELRQALHQTLADQWDRLRAQPSDTAQLEETQFTRALRQQLKQLIDAVQNTTCIMENLASLAGYDDSTYVHSINVAIYAVIVGISLHLRESRVLDLGVAAILHDIGKMWIPAEILNKPGRLNDEEWDTLKNHTTLGHSFLLRQPELSYPVANCALEHHERIDGSGYPRGLRDDAIHEFAKITAVADVYDAMVMHRPYRQGLLPASVMEHLVSLSGKQFSPAVVRAFRERVSLYPVGTDVTLSDGRVAVVTGRTCDPSHPVVRVLTNGEPEDIDLSKHRHLAIAQAHHEAISNRIDWSKEFD